MARSRRSERKGAGTPRRQPVPAAEFKATCLELMDHVRETGVEYIVTKHGVPVARLVPYTEPQKAKLFGSMKGTVLGYDRPLDPLDDEYSFLCSLWPERGQCQRTYPRLRKR
ncbi:MAG TPA: type II toxin-antitoxin system prevent-host-death family antitoxin [Vicinamibacterales bacterium]|nr:type II toxin-antitoxin system prevent-host-death family antitoxin [Vicinamibacterales bacterium]